MKTVQKNGPAPMGVKEWAEDDQPREKLSQKGAAAMSNAELLAILLVTGTPSRSVMEVARDLLQRSGHNLYELGKMPYRDLVRIPGIGRAKALLVMAAFEIGRRRQSSEGAQREAIHSSSAAAALLMPLLSDLAHEAFYALYLNQAGKLLKQEQISNGGMTSTVVDIRILLKSALLCGCSKMIVAHNHPSGNLRPSQADRQLTERIRQAAQLLDITLDDHLIVGHNSYLSMQDEGMISAKS